MNFYQESYMITLIDRELQRNKHAILESHWFTTFSILKSAIYYSTHDFTFNVRSMGH